MHLCSVLFLCTRCPYCRSVEFRRVGVRNAMERAILWLLQPLRCELCGHHFFMLRWLAPLAGVS